jgi:hypothetical protein
VSNGRSDSIRSLVAVSILLEEKQIFQRLFIRFIEGPDLRKVSDCGTWIFYLKWLKCPKQNFAHPMKVKNLNTNISLKTILIEA